MELEEITARLAVFLMHDNLPNKDRGAVLEDIEKTSFETYLASDGQKELVFDPIKLKIARQAINAESLKAKNVLELLMKSSPEKSLTRS